jgi:hypothetical protein
VTTFKKRSVLPIYAIALVWVIFTLVHPLYKVSDYVTVILLSAIVFLVAKGIWPTQRYELPDPDADLEAAAEEDTVEEDAEKGAEPVSTGDPKIDALIQEKDRALGEIRRLNHAISDPKLSEQINDLESTTAKILDHVISSPEKLPQIWKFMNYYLPTTLKILNAYDRMGAAGVAGENIGGTMERIETMMDTIVSSFHKQLDALFRDEAMDIASDITVMESLLAQEGLNNEGPMVEEEAPQPEPSTPEPEEDTSPTEEHDPDPEKPNPEPEPESEERDTTER